MAKLNKEQLVAALTAKEVTLTGAEKVADLQKLATDNGIAIDTPDAPKATGPITVKYRDHEGKPTERTFSADVHGEDFAALADEFKATNKDRLIADEA